MLVKSLKPEQPNTWRVLYLGDTLNNASEEVILFNNICASFLHNHFAGVPLDMTLYDEYHYPLENQWRSCILHLNQTEHSLSWSSAWTLKL